MTSITDVHKIDLVYYAIIIKQVFVYDVFQTKLYRCNHINSKAFNTIHTSKGSYKYSFISRTITYWNSLKTQQRGVFVMQIRRCLNDTI